MKNFKDTTSISTGDDCENAVIVGPKTYMSFPLNMRPLPGRINVVVASRPGFDPGNKDVTVVSSLNGALEILYKNPKVGKIFVCGGAELYNEAFVHPDLSVVYHTVMHTVPSSKCDTFVDLSLLQKRFGAAGLYYHGDIQEESGVKFSFDVWGVD